MVDGASSIFVVRRCSISPAPPPRGPRPRPSQSHAAAPWCAVHPRPAAPRPGQQPPLLHQTGHRTWHRAAAGWLSSRAPLSRP